MGTTRTSPLQLIAALEQARHGEGRQHYPELPERRTTRTTGGGSTFGLELLDLAQRYEAELAAYVDRHATPMNRSTRTPAAIIATAGHIADHDADADLELRALGLATQLKALLAVGDGHQAVEHISCPQCYCWSLLAVRTPHTITTPDGTITTQAWRAACRNLACGTPAGPRTFSLRAIARHHLQATRAA
jgi:hypothetical protein